MTNKEQAALFFLATNAKGKTNADLVEASVETIVRGLDAAERAKESLRNIREAEMAAENGRTLDIGGGAHAAFRNMAAMWHTDADKAISTAKIARAAGHAEIADCFKAHAIFLRTNAERLLTLAMDLGHTRDEDED